jgi:hypothetical protein
MMPALLTSTSMRRRRSATAATQARMLRQLVTSSRWNSTSRPSSFNAFAAALPLPASRAASTTLKPRVASCRQISNPIPRLPPVTSAIFAAACIV